jgi:multidrug efflux pump subunit AcrB
MKDETLGLAARIVKVFLTSRLSVLFMIASLLSGVLALLVTPREEEPQIEVPVADILVSAPGATAAEVEKLAAKPLESLLWEIDGVEYVYSVSRPGMAVGTVRFFVGEDREKALIKIYNKMMSNLDRIPPIVDRWIVKPIGIDDVPIVSLTFYPQQGSDLDDYDLRRIAEEVLARLQEIANTSRSFIVGGRPRQVRVLLDPERLAAHNLCALEVGQALAGQNVNVPAGSLRYFNEEILVEVGPFFHRPEEVEEAVVGVYQGRPVYVRDVARVFDGPGEFESYTRIGFGPAASDHGQASALVPGGAVEAGDERPAVTLAIAKRKGSNAVRVAERILERVQELRGEILPEGVAVQVTRNYGKTANEKVNELVKHLGIAVATIVVLIAFALGWREALIVALAVPLTLAVTLLGDLIVGYTINRVTLFALILSLGLLVDDPIVDVENIHRHFRLRTHPPLEATLFAVDEVRPPVILATFTVIVSFLPMFFVTGMMGPYMRPMPFNVPMAMLMSLLVAFTVTPWASYHLLKREYDRPADPAAGEHEEAHRLKELYRRILLPMLNRPALGVAFLAAVFGAFLLSVGLVPLGLVPLKMLPYDNKSELQIVVDMPEGTPLEQTDAVTRSLGAYLATVSEVVDYETYVGTSGPFDFNGMVRQYYLRQGDHVADIRVNLVDKHARAHQSHEIALRIRPAVEAIGRRYGANVKIVEMPPGPPVFATIVAEVYGPEDASYEELAQTARAVRSLFERTEGVVDVDDSTESDQDKIRFLVDREKAALHGIAPEGIARCIQMALDGQPAGTVHLEGERSPFQILLRLPEAKRSHPEDMLRLYVKGAQGQMVSLAELGRIERTKAEKSIYHKNLRPVVYVMGETAGVSPAVAILSMQKRLKEHPLPAGFEVNWRGEGEWKITLDVFRDLGIAFGVALALIYVLLVAQTGSLVIPVIIMVAIPLTVIGILPGFTLLNLLLDRPIGPYGTPVFFTATGMIGMIALAGIVVRNSIILIDFIHVLMDRGHKSLKEAIIEAGAVRTRPILLTAGAALFGSWVITLDPIFSGLAWSFIFGIFASTLFSLLVVPVFYYFVYRKSESRKA